MTASVRRVVGSTRGSPLSHAASRYVRTMLIASANDAASRLYEENADIVRAEQYVATLDTDTCAECGNLDGQVFEIVGGKSTAPRPTRHPHCRCFLTPVLKDWKQIGLSADVPPEVKRVLNGRRAERTTWNDWVTANPKRLEESLGPARAKLYKQGAKVDDFAMRNRVLNLDEIAAKRKRAA